jgi:hypothetical protein
MKTESAPFNANVKSLTVDALSFCIRQEQGLSTKIKPLALAIIQSSEPVVMMDQVFQAARGESVAAKLSNAKERSRALGRAWNRLVTGLNGHFANADLVASWPNFATAKGECSLVTAEVSKAARKAAKAEREESDARALETFQAERAQAEMDAIQAMSGDEIQAAIQSMLSVWCQGDKAAAAQVAANVVEHFTTKEIA